MIRTIAAELGLTIRCATVLFLTVAAFVAAFGWGLDALHGAVLVLAFTAGTLWNREIRGDECGISLESEDVAS